MVLLKRFAPDRIGSDLCLIFDYLSVDPVSMFG
jgi:hypothetical protein